MENEFIVQIDDVNFLTSVVKEQPYGTPYPGRAAQMSYDTADALARKFRAQGYVGAVACDKFGQVPTAADLVSVKRGLEYLVTFSGFYFVGVNVAGSELGSKDVSQAQRMSQEVALEVAKKLRAKHHLDAAIVESSRPPVDVEAELKKIWPSSKK